MKKVFVGIVVALCLGLVAIGSVFLNRAPKPTEGYLRIHIRANSNLEEDQNVKYKIKEKIVEYLTPLLSQVKTANDAMKIVNENLNNIDNIATKQLADSGFNYTAKSKLTEEYFPTRTYNELVLKDGLYDALIVELGTAKGNNWWCVVYPPLCFISAGSLDKKVEYKSIIAEFIEKIFHKTEKKANS